MDIFLATCFVSAASIIIWPVSAAVRGGIRKPQFKFPEGTNKDMSLACSGRTRPVFRQSLQSHLVFLNFCLIFV